MNNAVVIIMILTLLVGITVIAFSVGDLRQKHNALASKVDFIESSLLMRVLELERQVFQLEDRHFIQAAKQYVRGEHRVIVTVNHKNSHQIGLFASAGEGVVLPVPNAEMERGEYVLRAFQISGKIRIFNRGPGKMDSISLTPDAPLTYVYVEFESLQPQLLPGRTKEFGIVPGGSSLFSSLLRICSLKSL